MVAPNGGNVESFHINIPMDQVMVGAADEASGYPAGLEWPDDEILANVSAEIFKVRNERDTVIGVAARTVAKEESTEIRNDSSLRSSSWPPSSDTNRPRLLS